MRPEVTEALGKRRLTAEEEAELHAWSQDHLIKVNHMQFPKEDDSADDGLTPQASLNVLLGGEGAEGHPIREAEFGTPVSGFADAPDDVKADIDPLKVDELRHELEELGLDTDGNKDELRDRLAVAWSKA